MKNISRLFIIVLAIVFPLLAGNVVPSQAGISVIDEYGIGFYNSGDGTGWHEWKSYLEPDPLGNTLPMFFYEHSDIPYPYFVDVVAFKYGHLGDFNAISDIVRLADLLPVFGVLLNAIVLYSDEINPDIPADVGLPSGPIIPWLYVEEQLDGTFLVDFGDGNTMFVYSEGHAAATIDIKPGSFPNSINLSKKGVIPVAILGSSTFDVTQVNYSTVCFGGDCTIEAHGVHFRDVNGDGFNDAILNFATQQTKIKPGDTQACLGGQLNNGHYFAGCDSVRTVPR